MDFYRQVDLLVVVVTTVGVFVGCTLYFALSTKASLLIALGVFLIGLLLGRRIAKVLEFFG